MKATLRILLPLIQFGLLAIFTSAQDRIQVASEAVRVPVVVIDKKNEVLLTDLRPEHFRLFEDGREVRITQFAGGEADRLNVIALLEFSDRVRFLRNQILRPAAIFVSQILGAPDYAALISYDTRPHIHNDFTRNRQQLLNAVGRLFRSPTGMSESNLYDAIAFSLIGGTIDHVPYQGLTGVKGRTALLVITTTIDTFSRHSFDDIEKIAAAAGVPIHVLDIGQMVYVRYDRRMSASDRLTYLQQSNALRHLCELTGGRHYAIRFEGALESVLESIVTSLRFGFVLGFQPADLPEPGEERDIEVVVDLDGDGEQDDDLEVQHRARYSVLPEDLKTRD